MSITTTRSPIALTDQQIAPPPKKKSRRGALTFCNNIAVCSIQCKDLKTLIISIPSLRLDGKQAGKRSQRLVAFIPGPIDQNRCAHWRNPMDMIRQG